MADLNPGVRPATENDHEAAAEALALAFADDPAWAHPLYERNEFALTGTFPMPAAGPTIREMWRDPIPGPA